MYVAHTEMESQASVLSGQMSVEVMPGPRGNEATDSLIFCPNIYINPIRIKSPPNLDLNSDSGNTLLYTCSI